MEINNLFHTSLELAQALFEDNYHLRTQVFSFGFYKGKIVAVGRNKAKTHSLNFRNKLVSKETGKPIYDKGICAELDLFLQVRNKTTIPYNKLFIVNVRIDRNRQIKCSKPCSSCESLLKFLTPKRLFYTNEYGKFVQYF